MTVRTLQALLVVSVFGVAGCAGSGDGDGADAGSGVTSEVASTGDLFESTGDDTFATSPVDGTAAESVPVSDESPDTTPASGPAVSDSAPSPSTGDGDGGDGVDGDGAGGGNDGSNGDDDDAEAGGAGTIEGSESDARLPGSTEIFADEDVDDVPFCEAFASAFGVYFGLALNSAYELRGDDLEPDAAAIQPELLELFFYPGVADDNEVIRAEAPDSIIALLQTLFTRTDAAVEELRAVGLSGPEIVAVRDELANASGASDLPSSVTDDDRITAALDGYVAEVGPLNDALFSIDTTIDTTEADEFLATTCPKLDTAFNGPAD